MSRDLKHARKIRLIVEGIVAASLVGLLILQMQVSNSQASGSFTLFAATRAPGNGGKTVTIDSLNKSTEQVIDKVIAKLMSDGQTAGVELSIQKKGKTVYESGYGAIAKMGPRSKVVPAPNTRFQIDSLTKTVTAIAVLRMVEQGKVELNQPIGKYVELPNARWNKIPVRSYLGMITGIPDASTTNGTYQSVIASTAIKATKYGIGLDFEPGSKFLYSDVDYFILGELIGTLSPPRQHGFMPYTKANVLEPFGMMDTGFIPFGNGDLWPTPYNDGNAVAPRKPDAGFSGGGFVSTMSDLEKYAIGLYNRSVLSSKSYNEMWSRTVLTGGTNKGNSINFGLGWDDVALDSSNNLVRVSKNGGGWGWGSQLTIFPQAGDSVILLRNSNGGGNLPLASIDIGTAVSDKGAKPAISVNNFPNTCGGKLYVSGTGFLQGEHVSITVKNAPGSKAPQKLESAIGIADSSGNVTIQIPYSGNPYSGLPGCAYNSTATVVVTMTATGEFSGDASTEFYMRNCAITWTACPA